MIVAVLLSLAQTVAATPPSPDAEEVVVATERLKRFRAVLRKDRKTGLMRCVVKRASGDPALDIGICETMIACSSKINSERDIQPCMEPAMRALLPKMSWVGRKARPTD